MVDSPSELGRRSNAFVEEARRAVAATVLALTLFIFLLAFRPWLRSRLGQIADRVHKIHSDSFLLTIAALLITLVIAAPIPFFLGWASRVLAGAMSSPPFVGAVSAGLANASVILMLLCGLRALVTTHGVAEVHFR